MRRNSRPNNSIPLTKNGLNKLSDLRRADIHNGESKKQEPEASDGSNKPTPAILHSSAYKNLMVKKANAGSVALPTTRGLTDIMGPEVYSPLFQLANLNLPRDRVTMNAWNRIFYDTHPLVRNAINLHASYPISKINISHPEKKIQQFFLEMAENIDLYNVVYGASLEYWKCGEKIDGSSLITMSDGSVKPITDIKVGDYVLTHLGNKKRVSGLFKKPTNVVVEEHLKIHKVYSTGVTEPLIISGRHPILTVSKSDVACSTPSCRKKNMRILPGVDKCSNCGKTNKKNHKIDFSEMNDVSEGDIVFAPYNSEVIIDDRFNPEICYAMGLRISKNKNEVLSETLMSLEPELQLHFLAGLIDGDGCIDRSNGHALISTTSLNLTNQIALLFRRVGARPMISKQLSDSNNFLYRIKIKANEAYRLFYGKLKSNKNNLLKETGWSSNHTVLFENKQVLTIKKIEDLTSEYLQPFMYDIEVEDDHSYIANGIAIHNCFPYAELDREAGTWRKVTILNPDFIHVKKSPIGDFTIVSLQPDSNLQKLVNSSAPADVALRRRLPKHIIDAVKKGQTIPLDDFNISHLKLLSSPYDVRGTSVIVSIYKDLIHYDKLRESKFAQADGMINPLTLVKVGQGPEYRPTQDDIEAVRQTLEEAQYDKDFKMITHDGITIERVGFSGAVLDVASDIELIINNIYAGLMVPKSLIDQESVTYASSSIGLEVLRQRYDIFRNMIKKWLEIKIFAPIAELQGFYKYEGGQKILQVPTIDFNHMNLHDMNDYVQNVGNFVANKQISMQTLYRTLGLSYEEEKQRLKEEAIDEVIRQKQLEALGAMRLRELEGLNPNDMIPEPPDSPGLPGEAPGLGGEEGGIPGLELPGMGAPPGAPPGGMDSGPEMGGDMPPPGGGGEGPPLV